MQHVELQDFRGFRRFVCRQFNQRVLNNCTLMAISCHFNRLAVHRAAKGSSKKPKVPERYCGRCRLVDQAVGVESGGGAEPQRDWQAWRHFSRSSGVIPSQRSRILRRKPERLPPRWLMPPKRIRQRASRPIACQKVIALQPNSDGSSQFHKCITTSPPIQIKAGMATIASGAIQNNFFLFFMLYMVCSLLLPKIFINALQTFAQMQHGIAFAREQCVDVYAGFRSQFLEAAALDFVCDEDFALLGGKFIEGEFQFVE